MLRLVLAGLAIVFVIEPAEALDPNRTVSQYIHETWGKAEGLTAGTIYAIAQSGDGYLWIGAEKGLVRFDGVRFRMFTHAEVPVIPNGPVLGLVADKGGSLWIRSLGQSLICYRDGVFRDLKIIPGLSDYSISAMARGRHGQLLLAYRNAAVQYDGQRMTPILSGPQPLILSMAETGDGRFWLGARDAGLFLVNGGRLSPAGAAVS